MHLMTQISPLKNESIRSYLIRLAVSNDYASVQQMLAEFRDIKNLVINSCDQSLLNFTAQIANIENTSDLQPFEDSYSPYEKHLGYRTLMDKAPCICPACMTNQCHTGADWQLYPITHCPTHNIKLISNCVCGEAFIWDEDLLHYGCSNCDRSWNAIAKAQPHSSAPKHVNHFYQLSRKDRINFIEDLFTSIMKALRPYDSVHHGIKQLPNYITDWATISELAYALLTDREIIEQWLSSMCYTRQHYAVLGENAVFYPFTKMLSKLNNTWLISGFRPNLTSTFPSSNTLPSYIKTTCSARNKAAMLNNLYELDKQFINHLDQAGFAEMLGCELSLARDLFKLPSISTVTTVGRGRFSFIDISDFIVLSQQLNTAKQYGTQRLNKLSHLLDKYMLTCNEVLVEIYKHKLPIYIDLRAKALIDIVCINEIVLTEFLDTIFLKNLSTVTLSRAKRILAIPRERVIQLGKLGYIKEFITKPSIRSYTGESIASFLDSFVCIEHWAESHNACSSKVIKHLKDNNIIPELAPFIFVRSKQLENALISCQAQSLTTNEQLVIPFL